MTYKVLVVDDSSFFRSRVSDIINSDENLTVIDVAVNGLEAVSKAALLKPDVITMDIEMPLLNGIDAVKQIMAKSPTAILMFSSLTHKGAKATISALEAGALDFLPKKFNEIAKSSADAGSILKQRVLEIARKNSRRVSAPKPISSAIKPGRTPPNYSNDCSNKFSNKYHNKSVADAKPKTSANKVTKSSGKTYKLLAIGTSTGGPIALQKILTQFPANFPLPIVMVQHMPAAFTLAFANRLNSLCNIAIKEAQHGDVLQAGCAYLAPGGKQMILDGKGDKTSVKIINDDSARIAFKPSVDISFGSAAKVFNGDVLGIILTGMGSDGKEGARMLKQKGATIWSQDESSSVVYGMPQAVTNEGISSLALSLLDFPESILKEIQYYK